MEDGRRKRRLDRRLRENLSEVAHVASAGRGDHWDAHRRLRNQEQRRVTSRKACACYKLERVTAERALRACGARGTACWWVFGRASAMALAWAWAKTLTRTTLRARARAAVRARARAAVRARA
eukprot:6027644-Pleurochrysis_carterae.AAC.1